MANNLNTSIFTGNLTSDATVRQTNSGSPVLSFTVAVNGKRKDGANWVDDPTFVDCVLFGDRANTISSWMTKGTKIAVMGRLHTDKWVDSKTGQNRTKLQVIVNSIDFMSRRDSGNGGGSNYGGGYDDGGYQQPAQQYQQPIMAGDEGYDEENLPF
jgi:single-strand DNA-binding protein